MRSRLRRWFPTDELVACAIAYVVAAAILLGYTALVLWAVTPRPKVG